MVQLRADPWRPDYGAGAEASFGDDAYQPIVDTGVETADWSKGIDAPAARAESVCFVDGVMRADLRVLASENGDRSWGLLGSYAAGAVVCDGAARFRDDPTVGRVMILGGRMSSPPLDITVGAHTLVYQCRSMASDAPEDQRRALQRAMLEAEQGLAVRLAGEHLVFLDGPLHFSVGPGAEVIGVVKRMAVSYLDGDQATLLALLEPGVRTPLFGLGATVLDRYAWYLRLIPRRPEWHEYAGLVRCEVRMDVGLDAAIDLAQRSSALLPGFASRPGIDPRAPQNLVPIGALERRLRHLLGNPVVVQRALLRSLAEVA
jgi:hypothetical protein